jgi:hypothetical protein
MTVSRVLDTSVLQLGVKPTDNSAFDRPADSHSLAAAGQRERYTHKLGTADG